YTGQDDIVIGTPIAGRTRRETEGLIGCFVNTLALRTKAEAGDNFLTLLGRVREAAIGAYAHQELPFEQLVEEMHPERGQTHTPLFQVMFALQNAPAGVLSLPGLSLSYFEEGSRRAGSEMTLAHLTLIMEENAEGLRGSLLYNAGLFTEASIERLLGHFETLLASIAADPRRNLSNLSLLSEEERSRLLQQWNETAVAFPRHATLAELFAEQAARRPEAVALAFGDERLTYAELDARSNQLARYLRAQGVAPESLVGLCVERSMEMVVGLLGILKAGGAYLPLDPEYPRERLSYMLADARPSVVLTQERLEAGLPEQAGRVLRLDTDWPLIAAERTDSPGVVSTADNLAYVTYTSGSTGRPKGVCVTQRNVARLVKGADFASFDEAEVFLQMAPVTFDASTFEIWGSLLNGARLVIMPPGRASLEELGRVLADHGVTTLWLTAGLFHLMVDERLADLRGLRQLLAGGDVLSPAHVRKFLAGAGSQCRLINGYGPTENTTFTCCYPMSDGLEPGGSVPIGRPIANTRVYVLDANLEPVVTGAAGELYTGGDGLARGYLNQPALTAARFIPDPYAAAPGSRLYRTGDMARYLADGRLEFLGRKDEQVKVRGYRIELGEVEAALRAAPGVRDCAVAAREDGTGGRTLVAYFVGGGEGAILRERMAETLPGYMVPSAFVKLEALPLTPNGKLDRRALPEPVVSETANHTEGLRPNEELVAGLFAEMLGAERVGVEANFFELGGHSLLATRLATRLREIFKIQLPLRVVFEAATPAGIASAVADALRDAAHMPPPPPILPGRRGRQLPLSYAQQRLWFLHQLEPESAAYNVLTAVRLRGEFDAQAVAQSLAELVRRHEVLRTVFKVVDGQPTQVVKETMPLSLGRVDLSAGDEADREEAVRQAIRAEAGQPFDLGRGPLLRARLLRLSEAEHVLVLAMHHIVSDGWSMDILVRELTALYESFRRGETPPPFELRVQYADYACWQREWLRGETLEAQLAYWRRQLGAPLPVLELPTDFPRPAALAHHGASESFALAGEVARDLKAVSRREGVTLFMTLLAAFQTLLLRYTGQDDIIVGSPIANRTTAETEGLIGCFINTLALRADLSGGVTFSELLRRVREVTLGAYAHQDVPFELLVEELQPERKANYSPVFQVWFVLHNAPARPAALSGLSLSQEPVETGTAQFDLTMAMSESGGTLGGSLTYNTELFRRETVLRMLDHFQELLGEVARDPEQPLLDIPLFPGQAAVAPAARTGARAVGEVED
ncbi:MAG TPA: amino acid adenylation domain-containing protein, partial [Pyrinomonadaceae bacterium]|nr:amino acid adenylation domain-containing protein [Pyrinomonadaceae bacterium]